MSDTNKKSTKSTSVKSSSKTKDKVEKKPTRSNNAKKASTTSEKNATTKKKISSSKAKTDVKTSTTKKKVVPTKKALVSEELKKERVSKNGSNLKGTKSKITKDIKNIENKKKTLDMAKDKKGLVNDKNLKEESKKLSVKKKINVRQVFLVVIFFMAIIIFRVLLINKKFQNNDNPKNKDKNYKTLEVDVLIDEINDTNVEEVNPPQNPSNDYLNYMNLPLISVNFDKLLSINSDTVGYIKVNGMNINYPVVQAEDNKYYLNRSYDKSESSVGTIFLDYRCDINSLGSNTIIYGDSKLDNVMFGDLKNIFKNNWYQNTDKYVINLSTPKENTLWRVFSVYTLPIEDYYATTNFSSNASYQRFIDRLVSRSKYEFNTDVNINDKILTLSTSYNNKNIVMHARLIKRQVR